MRDAATVNYHIKSAGRQAFHFDVEGIVGNLLSPKLAPTQVQVQDLRDGSSLVDFENDGIAFSSHTTRVSEFDDSRSWVEIYDTELRALLADEIGAMEVIVFDHTVRIDEANADRRPARNVHNDYSEAGAHQRLIDILGEARASSYRSGHYGFVNVWRPVENSITTSPLGFVLPETVKPEDWMPIELIYPDRVGQILGLAASVDHEWFYLSRMTPDEVAIFNIYDNQGRPFLGHSALDMESAESDRITRKSIESRTLVRYR